MGGLEFCNQDFDKFLLKDQGITDEKTNPYSPEMNGCTECFNSTAVGGIKTLLNSSGLSQKFWAEAKRQRILRHHGQNGKKK